MDKAASLLLPGGPQKLVRQPEEPTPPVAMPARPRSTLVQQARAWGKRGPAARGTALPGSSSGEQRIWHLAAFHTTATLQLPFPNRGQV